MPRNSISSDGNKCFFFYTVFTHLSFRKEGTTIRVDVCSCQHARIRKYLPSVTREIAILIAVMHDKNRNIIHSIIYLLHTGRRLSVTSINLLLSNYDSNVPKILSYL